MVRLRHATTLASSICGSEVSPDGEGERSRGRVQAPDDYARFMEQLDAALEADGIVLYAWVAPYLGYGSESAVGKARKRRWHRCRNSPTQSGNSSSA